MDFLDTYISKKDLNKIGWKITVNSFGPDLCQNPLISDLYGSMFDIRYK